MNVDDPHSLPPRPRGAVPEAQPPAATARIDAHQHFWHYSDAEYGWIDDEMAGIRRDFLPPELAQTLAVAGVEGTVAVQARQSLAETEWLLELGRTAPFIKGVVGWVPLAEQGRNIRGVLDRLCGHRHLRGVRHVLQAEPESYFEIPQFNEALEEVARHDLAYDLLIVQRQLPAATAWVDRHPGLRIILDHAAKPRVSGVPDRDWCEQIRELARRPHLYCKFSGIATEAPRGQWSASLLRPYFEVVLEAFGPARVMFGSDWPVCLVATSYLGWYAAVLDVLAPLTPGERAAILGGTAVAAYQLQPT